MRKLLCELASGSLAGILTHQNHSVVQPKKVELLGESDPVQLKYAILKGLVALTRDHDDYLELHNLIVIGISNIDITDGIYSNSCWKVQG